MPGKAIAPPIREMTGGIVEGSGARMMTPNAAAQPSEQHAVEEEIYAPEPVTTEQPAVVPEIVFTHPVNSPLALAPAPVAPSVEVAQPAPPRPLYRRSETTTKIGAHQEIEPMLKQVSEIWGRMTKFHWFGVILCVVGFGGILHSAGNKESGYPLCWLKVFGAGVIALVMGDCWWFWALLALSGLLYIGQKFNVIRVLP